MSRAARAHARVKQGCLLSGYADQHSLAHRFSRDARVLPLLLQCTLACLHNPLSGQCYHPLPYSPKVPSHGPETPNQESLGDRSPSSWRQRCSMGGVSYRSPHPVHRIDREAPVLQWSCSPYLSSDNGSSGGIGSSDITIAFYPQATAGDGR